MLGEQPNTYVVGNSFVRHINQANRDCYVIGIRGATYIYEYEMPNGRWYYRRGNTVTGKERSISKANMPRWMGVRGE